MSQCEAITKKGKKCRNSAVNNSLYCAIHSSSKINSTEDRSYIKNQSTKKDFWDKISALSTLISGVLIVGIGIWATHHYNFAQLKLRQLEALDKFRPLLSSEKSDEREFAYTAFVSLGYEELALKIIALKDDRAGIKVLTALSGSKNKRISNEATELLSMIEIQSRLGGKKATFSRLRRLHPNVEFLPNLVFSVVSFSLRSFDILKKPERIEHVSKIIKGMEADILLFQEIPNIETVDRIASLLPDYEFVTSSRSKMLISQYMATFLKKDRVKLLYTYTVPGEFLRPPIGVTTVINGKQIDIINLHLSYGYDDKKLQRRIRESNAVLDWKKKREQQRPTIIAGVFNAEAKHSSLSAIKKIGRFATNELDSEISTLVKGHRKYTHFVLDNSAQELYISKSIFVYELPKILPELKKEEIIKEISDHNPVTIALAIPQ